MEFWRGNLADALRVAIDEQRKREQEQGYTSDSIAVAGWQQLLDAIKAKEISAVYLKD